MPFIESGTVDLIVTSPPYWKKRDYGVVGQIGQESTPGAYVASIIKALDEWKRVLRPTGSIFLNIGDTYWKKSLQGIPSMIEAEARREGWILRNRIIWVKKQGVPEPARDRLANRHEYIIHLAVNGYFYDLFGYAEKYSRGNSGANPGDIWEIPPQLKHDKHLAPFPDEIVERAITLACPREVCSKCGKPRNRIIERTSELDMSRPQARRAKELVELHNLTEAHIAAIQATGISDAGKALKIQSGSNKNSIEVQRLAAEAKAVLGGYFREFTFAKKRTTGWTNCKCGAEYLPGVVLDPFMGTGTTLEVAAKMGRSAIGVDLNVLPGENDNEPSN